VSEREKFSFTRSYRCAGLVRLLFDDEGRGKREREGKGMPGIKCTSFRGFSTYSRLLALLLGAPFGQGPFPEPNKISNNDSGNFPGVDFMELFKALCGSFVIFHSSGSSVLNLDRQH
jgi:hypothetical protein